MTNKVSRYLVVYDGKSEEVTELIALENYDLSILKNALDVPPSDPQMHDRYSVGPDDIAAISGFIKKNVEYDFSRYAYFIEAISDQ